MSADFDYTLLARYLAGSCPPEQARVVEAWGVAGVERRREMALMREVWARAGRLPLTRRADAGLARVVERVGLSTIAPSTPPTIRLFPSYERPHPWGRLRGRLGVSVGLAAALLLAAGVWLAWRRVERGSAGRRPAYSAISTALGQRLSLRLSDGSLVSLAPGSTLRTPTDYGKRDRVVELEGEALFSVNHDPTRPFAVRTRRAVATDVGTRFVVRAYRDDPQTDIVVVEGRVAVHQSPADSVIIGRAERVRLTGEGRVQVARNVALEDYLDWTEGRLVFRGVPLREAAKRLGRWYDIDIRLTPDAIGDRRILATADSEPAVDVLRTIAASLDLRLLRAGRVFTLSGN